MPPYDQHSFEVRFPSSSYPRCFLQRSVWLCLTLQKSKRTMQELRLACVRAGRPLTSQEIITQKVALKIGV